MYTGIVLPILVISVGAFFLVKLGAFFLFHPIRCIGRLYERMKDREARRSLFLALAGTLGVGNIFGVATGIIIGGAGSVFWLAVASLFSAVIKYAEATLSAAMCRAERGGMHKALLSIFPKKGAFLSGLYATLATLLAFFMGSAVQASAVVNCTEAAFGIPVGISAAVFLVAVALSTAWGGEKIAKITEKVIPLTTIVYIIATIGVIFINASNLPQVLSLTIKSAFAPASLDGGALSFLLSKAFSEGFARGTLSNEAGTGTSSLAHSRVSVAEPADAGLAGILEVFFDTGLLCVLTGIAILTSVDSYSSFVSPMKLVTAAFSSSLGGFGTLLLAVSIFLFAYSTVICWYYYGSECFSSLFHGKFHRVFAVLFLGFIPVGALVGEVSLLPITDTVILFMSLLTLSALVVSSGEILRKTQKAGLLGKRTKDSTA